MFWRRKSKAIAAPPQIACYGKLPATGDFVRYNATSDDMATFDRWLGAGIQFARQSMGASFDAAYQPAVGLFVCRTDGAGPDGPTRGMVGAWAASGDNAGRQFPMVVYGSYDYGQLVGTGAAAPIALWSLLTAAYELATTGRQLAPDAFVEKTSRISLPSLEDGEAARTGYLSWLGNQSMKALWETAFGTEESRYWVLENLIASVEPFRGQELPQTALGIRLPLGAGDAYAVSVWMDVTCRLAGFHRTLLNAFWTPRQSVMLHMGPPHTATFREMIAPTGTADHVADLCVSPRDDESTVRRRLGPQMDALVARTELSLSAFLEGLG